MINRRTQWKSKPSHEVQVKLDARLRDAFTLQGNSRSQLTGQKVTLGTSTSYSTSYNALGVNIPGSTSNAGITCSSSVINQDSGAILIEFYATASKVLGPYLIDSDTTRHALLSDTSSTLQWHIDGRSEFFNVTWSAGDRVSILVLYDKTSDTLRLVKNGVEIPGNGKTGTWGSNSLGSNFYIGRRFSYTASVQSLGGKVTFLATFNTMPTIAEAIEYTKNPWSLLEPQIHYMPTAAVAAGGTAGKSNPLYGPLGGPLFGAIG